jgi:serine/threonine protein kinase
MPEDTRPHDRPAETGLGVPGVLHDAAAAQVAEEDSALMPTGLAPPFRAPVGQASRREKFASLPGCGQQLGDFVLIRVLGEGAFGRVFLALQVSLDRQVALKVSANRGSEARTLASLEHEHIVRVFSETLDSARDLRLLCMQYVPGITLDTLLRALAAREPGEWSGATIVNILDRSCSESVPFDPAALRCRESLAGSDFVAAVCWLGARVGEALVHAHSQGVLHRDIKPANILLNPYGRPMLADFNIALDPRGLGGRGGSMFGGTLAYMAPEHLDAFNPSDDTPPEAVDERADVYSLGVVLFEMLTGQLPFDSVPPAGPLGESLHALSAQRRRAVPSLRGGPVPVPESLERVVRRCLEPDPVLRYQSAAGLADALEGCRDLRHMEGRLPPPGRLTPLAQRYPFLMLVLVVLLPNFLGSALNIAYNSTQIVGNLSASQQQVFGRLVLGYNLLAYCVGIVVAVALLAPAVRLWRQLARFEPAPVEQIDAVRRRMLSWPTWAVSISCAGWLPGGLLFPLCIHFLSEPIQFSEWAHFVVSFTLSGLIALTYSYLGAQYLVLRVLYPRFWADPGKLRTTMNAELGPRVSPRRRVQLLAGSIPLAGALLIVGFGPESFDARNYQTFRLLLAVLIVMGMAGFAVAMTASTRLDQIMAVLLGNEPRREG